MGGSAGEQSQFMPSREIAEIARNTSRQSEGRCPVLSSMTNLTGTLRESSHTVYWVLPSRMYLRVGDRRAADHGRGRRAAADPHLFEIAGIGTQDRRRFDKVGDARPRRMDVRRCRKSALRRGDDKAVASAPRL